ncbi:hypothetical protein PIB30_073244 [Stylosanthes scabra]|uniref:Uncharacterized protein n=1 Tax=Stylosanthes scabra TaxID=79078 RepID=A0ABU6XPL0_9FABA|nr:hypothetical protein [Stylosanthes scabra]
MQSALLSIQSGIGNAHRDVQYFNPWPGTLLSTAIFNLFSCALFSTPTATKPGIFSTKGKPLFLLHRENDPTLILGIFKLGCTSVTPFHRELSAMKLYFSGPASGPHTKFLAPLPGKQKCVSVFG